MSYIIKNYQRSSQGTSFVVSISRNNSTTKQTDQWTRRDNEHQSFLGSWVQTKELPSVSITTRTAPADTMWSQCLVTQQEAGSLSALSAVERICSTKTREKKGKRKKEEKMRRTCAMLNGSSTDLQCIVSHIICKEPPSWIFCTELRGLHAVDWYLWYVWQFDGDGTLLNVFTRFCTRHSGWSFVILNIFLLYFFVPMK